MAEKMGISSTQYSNYLAGKPPSLETLIIAIDVFGLSSSWLIQGEGPMFRASDESGGATEKIKADHSPDAAKTVEATPLKGESDGEVRALRQVLRLSEEVSALRAQLAAIEAKEAAIEAEADELHERLREMGKRNRERPKVG